MLKLNHIILWKYKIINRIKGNKVTISMMINNNNNNNNKAM